MAKSCESTMTEHNYFLISKKEDTTDTITSINEAEVDYLYKILNQHIERQNGDWDCNTEECLELLECLKQKFEDERNPTKKPIPTKIDYNNLTNLITNEGRDFIHHEIYTNQT